MKPSHETHSHLHSHGHATTVASSHAVREPVVSSHAVREPVVSSIIVSAYLDIPSKATKAFYMEHMRRLLGSVRNPMVFFTTPDMRDVLLEMRGGLPIYFSFVDSVHDLQAIKRYGYQFWQDMYDKDPERYHSPELGAVWYEKKEFVKRAIVIAGYNDLNTNIPFIWCDAGCVREDRWLSMISTFGDATYKIPRDTLLLQQLHPVPHTPLHQHSYFKFPQEPIIACAIMAGYKAAWTECSDIYDTVLASYATHKYAAISDQYVWTSAVQKHPQRFTLVNAHMYPTYNYWFFFLAYLSSRPTPAI